jgi:hypothetical protein
LFEPKTEELTLPEVKAPVVPSAFGGNVPQFGLPKMKVPRTVQPQPAPMDVLMATADLMKPDDFLKAYTEIKGKPTVHSLAPKNILVDSAGNKLGENTNTKPESEKDQWSEPYMASAGGRKGLVQKNLTTGQIKPVLQDVSTTIKVNTGISGISSDSVPFGQIPKEDKEFHFLTKMITGKDPKISARDISSQRQFNKDYPAYVRSVGFTAPQIAALQTAYKGKDANFRNMEKQSGPMKAFADNINKQVDTVEQMFSTLQRADVRALDLPLRQLKTKLIGSGLEQAYELFMQEISTEAYKLASGSSASIAQIPEGARKDWVRIHDPNLSLKQIMPVLQATRRMANIRISTWNKARDIITDEISNMGSTPNNPSPEQPKATHKYIPGKGIVEIK